MIFFPVVIVADRSNIESIINVLQTNLGQLVNPDIDSISIDDLELVASMCDQIVEMLKPSLFFLKHFNYHFSDEEEKQINVMLTSITKKLSLLEDEFVPDNGTAIYPLYLMVSKLDDEGGVSDLELYFIVYALAYHVHQEIGRRTTSSEPKTDAIEPDQNKPWYDTESDTFVLPSGDSSDEEEGGLILRLREPSNSQKGLNWLSLFEKA